MNLRLPIKIFCLSIFMVITMTMFSQVRSTQRANANTGISSSNAMEYRQRFGFISVGYHSPITTGDNFMGQGLEGKSGLDFKFQIYVYKQFFLGLYSGVSYFDVKDTSVVGNYKKTTLAENYFYVGYEFLPADRIRLGVLASLFGDARFKNNFFNESANVYQKDRGKHSSFGVYFNYELSSHLMVYIDYAYRTSKTDIRVAPELNDLFERGNYHSIGVGINFALGTGDLISGFIN